MSTPAEEAVFREGEILDFDPFLNTCLGSPYHQNDCVTERIEPQGVMTLGKFEGRREYLPTLGSLVDFRGSIQDPGILREVECRREMSTHAEENVAPFGKGEILDSDTCLNACLRVPYHQNDCVTERIEPQGVMTLGKFEGGREYLPTLGSLVDFRGSSKTLAFCE